MLSLLVLFLRALLCNSLPLQSLHNCKAPRVFPNKMLVPSVCANTTDAVLHPQYPVALIATKPAAASPSISFHHHPYSSSALLSYFSPDNALFHSTTTLFCNTTTCEASSPPCPTLGVLVAADGAPVAMQINCHTFLPLSIVMSFLTRAPTKPSCSTLLPPHQTGYAQYVTLYGGHFQHVGRLPVLRHPHQTRHIAHRSAVRSQIIHHACRRENVIRWA